MNLFGSSRECDGSSRHLAEVLVLGALLAFAWRVCGARHRHRRTSRSLRAPEHENTWEGEGGRPLPTEDVDGLPVAAPSRE